MPRALVALPTGTQASWLDLLLPSSSPPKPKRQPRATPQMLLRISALHHSLTIIKHSLITRTHMHNLYRTLGAYCITCTPISTRGRCGPTCPLLRPYTSSCAFYGAVEADRGWVRRLVADKAKYREIVGDMTTRGTAVYAATVARWERVVRGLREGCEVPSERWEKEGWPSGRGNEGEGVVVFREGWRFERAWRRGVMVGGGGGVAPEVRCLVLRGVKRKFEEYGEGDGGKEKHELLEGSRKRVKRV